MAEAGKDNKAKNYRKENCDQLQGVRCKKMGRLCNCSELFFNECPVWQGNHALKSFF